MGPYIVGAVALVCAGVAAAIVVLLSRQAGEKRSRALALLVAFVALVIVTMTISQYAAVYYKIPWWLLAALVVGWGGATIVASLAARLIGWNAKTAAALVALFFVSTITVGAVLMFSPFGAPVALFELRVAQMAEAQGFTALLPAGEEMVTDYLPVTTLPEPEVGLAVEYEGFVLQERKASGAVTEDDLRALVAIGESPLGGAVIGDDAEYTLFTVQGEPAVGVTFTYAPPEAASKPGMMSETVTILVLVLDGTDVRFESHAGMRYLGPPERYEAYSALSVERLAGIAETLAPASAE